MVAVNDQILLRHPFSFTRKQGLFKTIKETGTVDVSIPVQTGALNVKVWLSGPDIPASTFATASTQMPAGGSRVLRLDLLGRPPAAVRSSRSDPIGLPDRSPDSLCTNGSNRV